MKPRSRFGALAGLLGSSGFLMTYHYISRKDKEPWTHPSKWVSFYIRRFFRITPLSYALLVPSYLLNDPLSKWRHVLHLAYQSTMAVPPAPPSTVMHLASRLIFLLRIGLMAFSATVLATEMPPATAFTHPSPLPLSILWFAIGMLWAGILFSGSSASGLAERVRKFLSNGFSSFLADASYSVYLLHLLILIPIAYLLCVYTHWIAPARFLIALAVTASLSYGLARPLSMLERRGISWGKTLGRVSRPVTISATL